MLIMGWVIVAVGVIMACGSAWMIRLFVRDAKHRYLTEWERGTALFLAFPLAMGVVLAGAMLGRIMSGAMR